MRQRDTHLQTAVCECERECNSWTTEGGASGRSSDDLVQALIVRRSGNVFLRLAALNSRGLHSQTRTPTHARAHTHTHITHINIPDFPTHWSAAIMKCRLKSIWCDSLPITSIRTRANLLYIYFTMYCNYTVCSLFFFFFFSCGIS